MNLNTYCKLSNGTLVPKYKVDDAMRLIASLSEGFSIVELEDMELFTKGNKFDAIRRFREKHDVSLMDAHASIEYLRDEYQKGE